MRQKPVRALKIGLILLVLVGGIAGGAAYWRKRGRRGRGDSQTTVVIRKSISHTLQLAGKVIPINSVVVTPRQSGRIIEIKVQEGSQVQEGDLLFSMRLEAAGQTELLALRSEVRGLEIGVQAAAARLGEKQPVRELIGTASVMKDEQDLDKLRLDLKTAKERLAVLETDLGLRGAEDEGAKGAKGPKKSTKNGNDGTVYVNSPRTGIVTLIDKRPGDFVWGGGAGGGDAAAASDRTVMTIADMSSLQVRTRVLEADLRYVQRQLPVNVKLDAYPDSKYTGVVTHIGGQGRTDTKAGYTYFDVDVSVDQKDARVLPEMNATIELIFARKDDVLTLPLSSVAIFPDRAIVHTPDGEAEDGFKEKAVHVGIVNETEAEITEGLAEGERVLEIDFAKLKLDDKDSDDPDAPPGGKSKGKGKGKGGGGILKSGR